jgi:glycosyltransferase involved in cell wall biosynthesis
MTVTIITPCTHDRAQFIERLAICIERQTVQPFEWLIDYEGGRIGEKRNRLNASAKGDIIIPMDSDDIYLPTYIERAVIALQMSGRQLVGLDTFPMHNVVTNEVHQFNNPMAVTEATHVYYRRGFPLFPNVRTGEGKAILKQVNYTSYNSNDFMATVHGGNTCSHEVLPLIKKLPEKQAALILSRFYY